MATFVLVHGAFHGGWCWRGVVAPLRAAGHEVFAPTLTGLGERSHLASPAVDLSTHVRDVANLIEWEELRDVVLVGHSYGGMVITGVADRLAERLRALVYLDALVPEDGQCALDLQLPERREAILEEVAANGGWQWPPRPAEFYGVRDPAKQAWVDGKCTPQPFRTLFERLHLDGPPGARISRKLYIRCTDPPLAYMRRFYEWASGAPGWQVTELATGHDAMVTEPEALAQILADWAEG
ncbi:MAG: alpha/beta fold hydrolase [Nitriliruptorales bacterium]